MKVTLAGLVRDLFLDCLARCPQWEQIRELVTPRGDTLVNFAVPRTDATDETRAFMLQAIMVFALARRTAQDLAEPVFRTAIPMAAGTPISMPLRGSSDSGDIQLTPVFTPHPNAHLRFRVRRAISNLSGFLIDFKNGTDTEDEARRNICAVLTDLLTHDLVPEGSVEFLVPLTELIDLYGEFLMQDGVPQGATWCGFDFDGQQPKIVDGDTVRLGARRLRDAVITSYQQLLRAIERRYPEQASTVGWCRKLEKRLEATRPGLGVRENAYNTEGEFAAHLSELHRRCPESGLVTKLSQQFARLGFTLLEPHPRFGSRSIQVLVTQVALLCENSPEPRPLDRAMLARLKSRQVCADTDAQRTDAGTASWVLDLLLAVKDVAAWNKRVRYLLLSDTETHADWERCEVILQRLGLAVEQVVPIFESPEAIDASAQTIVNYLEWYQRQRGAYPHQLVILFGGSDTNMKGGMMEWFTLARAVREAQKVCQQRGVKFVPYFGRADVPVRWGGNLSDFLGMLPPLDAPQILHTVQGDDMHYRLIDAATAAATCRRQYGKPRSEDPIFEAANWDVLAGLITQARSRFQQLTRSPEFGRYLAGSGIHFAGLCSRSNRPGSKGADGVGSDRVDPKQVRYLDQRAIRITRTGLVLGTVIQGLCLGTVLHDAVQSTETLRHLQRLYSSSRLFCGWIRQLRWWVSTVDHAGREAITCGLGDAAINATLNEMIRKDVQACEAFIAALVGDLGEDQWIAHPKALARTARAHFAAVLARTSPGIELSPAQKRAIGLGGVAILCAEESTG